MNPGIKAEITTAEAALDFLGMLAYFAGHPSKAGTAWEDVPERTRRRYRRLAWAVAQTVLGEPEWWSPLVPRPPEPPPANSAYRPRR